MSYGLKIFPSSLAEDWGRILTESNVKGILQYLQTNNNTIKNAVIKGFTLSHVGNESGIITLTGKGSALFEGYQIECIEDQYTNIKYPAGGPGTYYICLHVKMTTGTGGISDFIVYEDYKDINRTFTSPAVITGDSPKDSPFIIVKDPGTDTPLWTDGIPDNLGTTKGAIEEGYAYKYIPLYLVTVETVSENSIPVVGDANGYVTGANKIQDLRGREFIPTHFGSIGYLGDDLSNYFGIEDPNEVAADTRLDDWRNKYILSAGGNYETLEQLLVQYLQFIHEDIRGYNTNAVNLSTLTNSDAANNVIRFWTQINSSDVYGTFLPIQNVGDPRNSIIAHLRYDPNEIENNNFSKVGTAYINESIVRRSGIATEDEKNAQGEVSRTGYRAEEYIYNNPTEGNPVPDSISFTKDYLVTLDNNNQVNRKFLPLSNAERTGILSVTPTYFPHTGGPNQDIFEYTEDGVLKTYAALYSVSRIGAYSGDTLTEIPLITNNLLLTFGSGVNKLNKEIFNIELTDSQSSGSGQPNTNPSIKVVLENSAPLNTAYSLTYDQSYIPGTDEYVINQNLLTTSDVIFNNLTLNGSLTVDNIKANVNNVVSIGNSVEVSGTLTADKVYNAVYNDYAELFKKNPGAILEPGDIVAMDSKDGFYTKANPQYPGMVVGVYSDTYGHLLGGDSDKSMEENLKNYIPVGISGRVFVKVYGPIEKGDLITLSTTYAGIGQRVTDTIVPGTILGKCLQTKNSEGVERVEMLIMPQ